MKYVGVNYLDVTIKPNPMQQKQILQELCSALQTDLNNYLGVTPQTTVELFSGIRTVSHHIIKTHQEKTGTTLNENQEAWFVEIIVDSKVVFRETQILDKNEDPANVEKSLINKVFLQVFKFGVISSKRIIDELLKQDEALKANELLFKLVRPYINISPQTQPNP